MAEPDVGALFGDFGDETAGCAWAVVEDGGISALGARGMADLERGVALSPDSLLNLGSTSKQFTAMGLLLLQQDGLLSLEDDIRKHVPEVHQFGPTITLRHLMHHTSGLRDTYPDLLLLAGWRFTDHITQADCLRLIYQQRQLSFEPGSEHLYVNANYVLLAEVIARISGLTLKEFSRERIFDPLGMTDTFVMDDAFAVVPGRALGYYEYEGWHSLPLTDTALGSTNVYSTARDMARWLANFWTGEVGGPEVMRQMVEPGILNDGTVLTYAGGLNVGSAAAYRGRPAIEHGGQHGGYCTSLSWFPEDRLGIVVLFNSYRWDSRDRLLRVADLYLPEAEAAEPPAPVAERRIDLDSADAQALSGIFYDATRRAVREVPFSDGALTYMGLEMIPVGPGEFTFESEPTATVRIAGDRLVLDTAERAYEYQRVEPVSPDAGELASYAGRYESAELGVVWQVEPADEGLRIHRPKHADTHPRPLFEDAFLDDWAPVDFQEAFLIEFERGADGELTGLRISGNRARGVWFGRIG